MKILLVDDSSTIRRALQNQLKQLVEHPLEFVEATDGQDALDALELNDEIALILLDINMPIMRGDQFLKILRKDPKHNKIKVMIITTDSEREFVLSMTKLGISGYLVKPFNKNGVRKAIVPLIQRILKV
jgi:two-component system chemotaxis response regulator CheY